MKHVLIWIFITLSAVCLCHASELLPQCGSRGEGSQFKYDPDQWTGAEQIVTSLRKGDDTILFVRTAKGEFEVRKNTPEKEVFFRFSTTWEAMSPGLRWAVMVDFVETDGAAAVLLLGYEGYYYVRASKGVPRLEYPYHYIVPTALKTGKWFPVRSYGPRDFYYPEKREQAESNIEKVKLLDLSRIEFERRSANKEVVKKDVFLIDEGGFFMNGTKVKDESGPLKIDEIRCDITVFSNKILQGKYHPSECHDYDRGDILALVARIKDEQEREKVKRLVNSAFESK